MTNGKSEHCIINHKCVFLVVLQGISRYWFTTKHMITYQHREITLYDYRKTITYSAINILFNGKQYMFCQVT